MDLAPQQTVIDAERSILGGILLDCSKLPPGLDRLRPEDFIVAQHRAIFSAMLELTDRSEPIDAITVGNELTGHPAPKDGWVSYLCGLTEITPTSANVDHYAEIVRRESRRRDFLHVMATAMERAQKPGADGDEILTSAVLTLGRLSESRATVKPTTLRALVGSESKAIEKRANSGGVIGVPTGFKSIDACMGGLQPGGVTVIAARPSMGKSALVGNILRNMAIEQKKSALLFSVEMTCEEQAQRFISSEARVALNRLRSGKIDGSEWPHLANAIGVLYTDGIALVDRAGISITDLRTIARQYAASHPVDVIAVDYLQLLAGTGDNREQEVASVSRGLKALAMELRVPVIAVSQLSRSLESRNDKRPMLSDLRESGSIEQDAHQVVFIYRDDYYHPRTESPGIAEIGIAKNRNGPTGMVRLKWSGCHVRFSEIEESRPEPQTALFGYEQ